MPWPGVHGFCPQDRRSYGAGGAEAEAGEGQGQGQPPPGHYTGKGRAGVMS